MGKINVHFRGFCTTQAVNVINFAKHFMITLNPISSLNPIINSKGPKGLATDTFRLYLQKLHKKFRIGFERFLEEFMERCVESKTSGFLKHLRDCDEILEVT